MAANILLISGDSIMTENIIKIPKNIKLVFFSDEDEDIDWLNMNKKYIYKENTINDIIFDINNGLKNIDDNVIGILQGLYIYNSTNIVSKNFTLNNFASPLTKESINKSLYKDSILQTNFSLSSIFNLYSNAKTLLLLATSRKKYKEAKEIYEESDYDLL
jgi:hypothetical protein